MRADIPHMTSISVDIVPLVHRQGSCILFAAIRWLVLVIGLHLEGHSVIFLAIQTHLSCRFLLAVDWLSLRRSGSSSQIINQPQDYFEQASRNSHFGQLEGDVAAMSDNLGTDLHQLLS